MLPAAFDSGCTTAVVFDFDYTLADSSRGACACIDYALRSMGLPAAPDASVTRTIGLSLPDTLAALAPSAGPERSPEFSRLFLERAEEVMVDLTELYEPVPAAIAALLKEGLRLAIVSTKYRVRIEAILAREGLREGFAVIVGGEDVAVHKPDPTGLREALKRLGCEAGDAVYVGDSVVDAETARRAEVPFIATLTGTTTRGALSEHVVEAFVDHLGELPAALVQRTPRSAD